MNKKKFIIISITIIILILLIISIPMLFKKETELSSKTDAERFKQEYEELNNKVVTGSQKYIQVNISSDNIIKYSNIDDVLNIFENQEDAVIYFGYPSCSYCRSAIQVLLDTTKETKLDVINYIDIEEFWEVKKLDPNNKVVTEKEPNDKYYELLSVLGDEVLTEYILYDESGNEIKTGDKKIEAPLVVFITNGEISGYNKGTIFSHKNQLSELEKVQKEGLSSIYNSGINDVVSSKKNKGIIK